MNSKMSFVFRVALILSVFLSACGAAPVVSNTEPAMGELYAMTTGATQLQVMKTMAGYPNAFILQNGQKLMFFWPLGESRGAAFWGLDLVSMRMMATRGQMLRFISAMNGQIANCVETACLVDWMQINGWKVVDAAALTVQVRTSVMTIVSTSIRTLPTFVILPVNQDGLFIDHLYPEPIQE